MGIFRSTTIRTRNKLKMKSLEPSRPHPPARAAGPWYLSTNVVLLLCKQPSRPISFHTKKC